MLKEWVSSLFQKTPTKLQSEPIDTKHFPGRSLETLVEGVTSTKTLPVIRKHARTNPYMKRYLNLVRNYVLGADGIQIQGVDEAKKKKWRAWAKNADLTKAGNWVSFQKRVLTAYQRDGEALVQFVYVPGEGLKLFLIDTGAVARNIGVQSTYVDGAGQYPGIKEGIRYDEYGRPVSYLFQMERGTIQEVPANQIVRVWDQDEPKQYHGRSVFESVIDRLKRLEEFEQSHIENAISNALQGGFITLPDTIASAAPPGGLTYTEAAKNAVEARPGDRSVLLQGMGYVPNTAQFPATGYQAVRRGMLADIAADLKIGYHSLASDLTGANYSSLRHGWQTDIKLYRGLQEKMEGFNQAVFDMWNMVEDEDVEWTAPSFPYLDPAKEASAQREFIKMGVKSASQIIREEEGGDPEKVFEERQDELEKYPHLRVFATAYTEEEDQQQQQEEREESEDEDEEKRITNG